MIYLKNKTDLSKKDLKIIIILFLCLLISSPIGISRIFKIDFTFIENFSTIFISIILEAIPFILLGSFVSSLIQVFVSEDFIERILPKNKFLGILGASIIGLILPICECSIIPIVKKLVKKGVPLGIAITFMLSVPIVNTTVLISTYYAFYNKPIVVVLRTVLGLATAIIVGSIITFANDKEALKKDKENIINRCSCGCEYNIGGYLNLSKTKIILNHTTNELLNTTTYLIIGSFISSLFQCVISKNSIISLGQSTTLSIIVMMILAFVLSICSEADAFVVRTFISQFTLGSILGFLVFGPMIDIKNSIMLFFTFKTKFVIKLIIYISLIIYIFSSFINLITKLGVI